jgi:hypothetical protein
VLSDAAEASLNETTRASLATMKRCAQTVGLMESNLEGMPSEKQPARTTVLTGPGNPLL